MHIEARVANHNPVNYMTLDIILERLQRAEKHHAMIYIGHAHWRKKEPTQPGWVHMHDGVCVDPLNGGFFYVTELDPSKTDARLLQPGEVLYIEYHGEHVPEI